MTRSESVCIYRPTSFQDAEKVEWAKECRKALEPLRAEGGFSSEELDSLLTAVSEQEIDPQALLAALVITPSNIPVLATLYVSQGIEPEQLSESLLSQFTETVDSSWNGPIIVGEETVGYGSYRALEVPQPDGSRELHLGAVCSAYTPSEEYVLAALWATDFYDAAEEICGNVSGLLFDDELLAHLGLS